MFGIKNLKAEIKDLKKEVWLLNEKIWSQQNPFGEVIFRCNPFAYSGVYYKPNSDREIHLQTVFVPNEIRYHVKKSKELTYVVLEFKEYVFSTPQDIRYIYAIKDDNVMKLDKPIEFESFDKEGMLI